MTQLTRCGATSSTICTSLATVEAEASAAAFAGLYEWTHRAWSPVTDTDELIAVSRREVGEANPNLSVAGWFEGGLAALALAFPRDDGVDVVAETLEHDQPRGKQLVAGVLSVLLGRLAGRGGGNVHIDGHVTDPHLQPVSSTIPDLLTDPVDLVELV